MRHPAIRRAILSAITATGLVLASVGCDKEIKEVRHPGATPEIRAVAQAD